ncbi:MAG: chromosome partitioning protein ParB [Verrucomicrobia bacterium]|nr:MAG: chromosome partitioning protein ParB [Verrucomicrobiota bacterium]PYJ96345.1 MAG: chromosome partitioning protein ParB [Verrucomicrobiota bacterium]
MNEMKIGFEMRKICLALEDISPMRQIKDLHKGILRYKKILGSIKEVGLVEPLVVYPQKDAPGKYLLKNGHLRYVALKELGKTSADCIIATDDECYTYNARVSRLSPIQEHRMIVKAVNDGVSPERLAAALNMPLHVVKASMNLLNGIHDQAAELLKDKNISPQAIRLLKRVSGMRQIEIAEMMVTANNFFTGYAEALVLGTPKDQLVNPDELKKKKGMSAEDIARMESEMESLERDLKAVTDNYTENMFTLQTAQTYIKNLLKNAKVVRYLNVNHSEIFSEFESIAAVEAM